MKRARWWLLILPLAHAIAGEPDESDRLFALALRNWNQSTSPYVEDLLRRSLALRQAALPSADSRVTEAEDQLARVYYNRGISGEDPTGFAKAEPLFARAATGARQTFGPKHLTLAKYLGDLGASLREQRRYTEAIARVCESLSIRYALSPPNAPILGASLDNMGLIQLSLGNMADGTRLRADANSLARGTPLPTDTAAWTLDRFCASTPIS